MIVFTLFILIGMLMAVGLALDTVRAEFARIKLQNTIDSAILAAADLDQSLEPQAVLDDYFTRAGLDPSKVTMKVTSGIDAREISATFKIDVPTMFMDMVGIKSLAAPATGTAIESVTDLEIALVLDNSGSMGQNNNARMDKLKPAAKTFLDIVLADESGGDSVSISIVPFATQVNAGADLLSHYTGVSTEHTYSDCVTFADADFNSISLPTTHAMERTAHFDPNSKAVPVRARGRVCNTSASRQITPWSDDIDLLKSQIDSMFGQGWTSIEIGTKWGAALLDPSSRPVMNAMIDAGLVNEKFRGQPFAFDEETQKTRKKFLVVMSDGANTNQWDIKDPYRSGISPVYSYLDTNDRQQFSYFKADTNQYYRAETRTWHATPNDADDATQLTWPEVWASMGVKKYTEDLVAKAEGGSAGTYYGQIVRSYSSGVKNARTQAICSAAKDKGITVYAIGMDTYGAGTTTLSNCSSGPGHFFHTNTETIKDTFAKIARSINQLRLTQ